MLRSPIQEGNTHLAFVGHTDHVPEFFTPYEDAGNLHGAGASDMQAGLASMIAFVVNHPELFERFSGIQRDINRFGFTAGETDQSGICFENTRFFV